MLPKNIVDRFLKLRTQIQKKLENLIKEIKKQLQHYRFKKAVSESTLFDKTLVAETRTRKFPEWRSVMLMRYVLSPFESKIFSLFLWLWIGSVLVLGFFAYFGITKLQPAFGEEYTEGVVGSPRFINPLYASTNQVDTDIARLVFSSLFRMDQGGKLAPDLASTYSVSPDGKIYTIGLKPALFHDGKPVQADDVVFTVQTIQNKDIKSPLQSLFTEVTVKKINDQTVEFRLAAPNPLFLSFLGFGILPQHLWGTIAATDVQLSILNIKPVGSGPYMFTSLAKDDVGLVRSITLSANPNYYGQNPHLALVTFTFFPNDTDAAQSLMTKAIDGMAFFGAETPVEIKRRTDIKLYEPKTFQYTALFFNMSRQLTSDRNIRTALAKSLDREKVFEVTRRGALAMVGPIPPELLQDYEPAFMPPAITEAEKLLDANGWARGKDGVRKKIIKAQKKRDHDREMLFEINLVTVDEAKTQKAAELIKEAWLGIGVKVNLDVVPRNAIPEIVRARNYDALLYGQALGEDLDLLPFWHSREINFPGLNLSMFASREADALLEKAHAQTDFEQKKPYYENFAKILEQEVPAVFLWSPKSNYAVAAKVHGVSLDRVVNPADRFIGIANWYIKSKRVLK